MRLWRSVVGKLWVTILLLVSFVLFILTILFPIVVDKEEEVQNAYGIDPLPTTMLINPDGEIEKIITGTMSEEDIIEDLESIKP